MTNNRLLGLALAAGLTAAAGSAPAADLVFSGVSTTSDDYALGVVWSGIAKEAGIDMTVIENGSVAGLRKAAQGEVDLVGIGAPHYLDAVGGTGKFEQDPEALREAYKEMKVILALPTGMAQYVTAADSDIKSFRDLDGHSVGIGRPGGNAGHVSQILFEVHGIEVDGQHLEYVPALEQLASGTLDAALVWGSIPTAAIDNASRGTKLRPDTLPAFREAVTNGRYYVYQKVPEAAIAKAYEDRVVSDGPARFWTFPYQIMVRGDLDEETVYDLTKALWEDIDRVHGQSAALSLITLDSAFEGISGELHPGAERYYREIGAL
jgi:TRAP transporter TAXI family solute receptor